MAPVENFGRRHQPSSQGAAQAGLTRPKASNAIPEFIVPLGKTGRMITQLIAVGPRIPGLGYQLQARQNRILTYGIKKARALIVPIPRSEEHTSELQSLMRISYAVFCLKKKKKKPTKSL